MSTVWYKKYFANNSFSPTVIKLVCSIKLWLFIFLAKLIHNVIFASNVKPSTADESRPDCKQGCQMSSNLFSCCKNAKRDEECKKLFISEPSAKKNISFFLQFLAKKIPTGFSFICQQPPLQGSESSLGKYAEL